MINRDDIEAGDKCYTRDGGCLVARMKEGRLLLGVAAAVEMWRESGLYFYAEDTHPLDIIRIEKAPKPVFRLVHIAITIGLDNGRLHRQEYEARIKEGAEHVFQFTVINGQIAKWEQVK